MKRKDVIMALKAVCKELFKRIQDALTSLKKLNYYVKFSRPLITIAKGHVSDRTIINFVQEYI